jgi:transcriptional regulator GlxA family with amidase domain
MRKHDAAMFQCDTALTLVAGPRAKKSAMNNTRGRDGATPQWGLRALPAADASMSDAPPALSTLPRFRRSVSAARAASPIRVAFLLVPQFSMMAFSAAIEPLRSANRISGRTLFEWRLVSADGHPVTASNGIAIAAHESLEQVRNPEMLVVCAGLEPAQYGRRHKIHHHLRRVARNGSKVGAISSGSFILADAGLLTDRRCTVHWEYAQALRARFPGLDVSTDLYVVDRQVFTCSGGTAALDMMLHFVSEASSREIALAVAEQFIHPQIRHQEDQQRIEMHARYGIESPKLVEIIARMEGSIEHPLEVRQIAQAVGISARQVERLFREQIGHSPKSFYRRIRLEAARTLLRQTIQSILSVALQCGFSSTSHFCHAYKRAFGVAPTDERHTAVRRLP